MDKRPDMEKNKRKLKKQAKRLLILFGVMIVVLTASVLFRHKTSEVENEHDTKNSVTGTEISDEKNDKNSKDIESENTNTEDTPVITGEEFEIELNENQKTDSF